SKLFTPRYCRSRNELLVPLLHTMRHQRKLHRPFVGQRQVHAQQRFVHAATSQRFLDALLMEAIVPFAGAHTLLAWRVVVALGTDRLAVVGVRIRLAAVGGV